MSEKKEEKINPNVEKILAELASLKTEISSLKTSSAKPEHEHWKAEDVEKVLANEACPECKVEAQKLRKTIAKKFRESRKELPFVCEECGLGVKKEEEECPECGSKNADKREG